MTLHPPDAEPDLLPVRMLNEYAYCPRLFHLMHVEGRWEDNAYTVQGRVKHRRVDRLDDVLPDAVTGAGPDDSETAVSVEGDIPPVVNRSVSLASEQLGLSCKLDLVATADDDAVPVETKRGKAPSNAERSWEPERVQLMAQGLLLREQGYRCDHGVLYYAGSRTRVDVAFTAELEQRTSELIDRAHKAALATVSPLPLDDSPKCNGCSLAGICLPDETRLIRQQRAEADGNASTPEIRRFFPARDDALPVYIQEQGAVVGKSGGTLTISKGGQKLATARLADVSQVVLCGNISITAQATHLLCEKSIPIIHLSMGHWFYGITQGMGLRNAFQRSQQFRVASMPTRCLDIARSIVAAKVAAQRTLLRRNASPAPTDALDELAKRASQVESTDSIQSLLGVEGNAARSYFAHFALMLKGDALPTQWEFDKRNRRPPRDPINAMLSFGYALLAKESTVALLAEGLDPWWGFYHQPRHGRPALALDLMEEFRAPIVDSAVLTAVNTGMVHQRNFKIAKAGCTMNPAGRKAFIRAYEARLDQLVTHPIFDYRCSWRTIIRLQAKLLSRWVTGENHRYVGMATR